MQIQVANQQILVYIPDISRQDAQKKATEKKISSFDAMSVMSSFISKPKDEDFELIYSEHRYEPYWYVKAKARYVYDRSNRYAVSVSGKEVQQVTILDAKHDVISGKIQLSVLEHCVQNEEEETTVDGMTGKSKSDARKYEKFTPVVVKEDIQSVVGKDAIVVPPQTRVSALMRDTLAKMIKGIQADTIHEEQVEVTHVHLLYHPLFAFEYFWKSKNKKAIIQIDGMTGEVSTGNRTFREFIGKALDRNFLFDLGADAAGIFIPGGSIAVKVAKRYIDTREERK